MSCHSPLWGADAENPATLAKIHGGLVVQLGGPDAGMASELADTGRYIIHLLDTESGKVEKAQTALHAREVYGVASAETVADYSHLPYTENLINLIVAGADTATAEEIFRVLVPEGALVVTHPGSLNQKNLEKAGFEFVREVPSPVDESQQWIIARKPWPESMGHWTHSRHDANGNAVSPDTAVGEPKRIRWIAGHSGTEVEGMVSDGGRNFYGHSLTRDSFNGMRLWHRDLTQTEEKMDPSTFTMKRLSGNLARPVATENYLFAVAFPTKNLVALDSKTGEIVRSFPEIAMPKELVQHKGIVVATCPTGIYGFSAETGAILWKQETASARTIVAGSDRVSYIQGEPRRGEKSEAVTVDLYTGKILWKNSEYPWLDKVKRSVLYGDQLTYEVSSMNNSDTDNGIHIVSAKDGELSWEKTYAPGMNHNRQARAMFIGDDLWIQQGGKVDYDDKEKVKFQSVEVTSLDRNTGETKKTLPAGLGHCAPPVATVNMIFSGVVEMTDLKTGNLVLNSITKSNCSRENGFTPANGLIYATPKHCTCWPMLRGYVAMAPEHPGLAAGNYPPALSADEIKFKVTAEGASVDPKAPAPSASDWPMYRHDVWRSSSSTAAGPKETSIQWSAAIAPKKDLLAASSPLRFDWDDNPFVKGRLSPPTIANGRAFVARPDAHEVVAVDTASGKVAWRFTARGRVDTPPTIHNGLAIFGDHGGYVHAVRADNGKPVWKFQAAPIDERIGAYGQIESAWPVAGSVLVMEDAAYFVAGRQELSDGGVFIFSVDPMTGKKNWAKKHDSIPQKGYDGDNDESFGFYKNSGLEFDPVDLLHKEGDRIAMSRWLISLDGKEIDVDTWNGFAKLNTGAGTVFAPRGTWTYGFRQIHRFSNEAHRRPLCVYRDNTIVGALNSTTALYRRDFDIDNKEEFNSKWITGWEAAGKGRKGERPYRSDRVAEKAAWKVNPWAASDAPEELLKPTTVEGQKQLKNKLYGMVMDSQDRLYVVHQDGTLKVINTKDGSTLSESQVPAPMWDGLALAENRLFLSTEAGELVCIGDVKGAKVALKD
ncbi:MAG: outer membrane protein assembly factor BamB family protein [Verrucomicrobiales bacterium]